MNDIRTITLDLDDTLWAIHPVIKRAEERLYAWIGEHYPRITELFDPAAMMALRSEVITEFDGRSHDLTFLRRTVLARLGEAAGYGDSYVDDAFAVFNEVRNDVTLFPEARPALVALRERFTLVAVTNGNADLEKIGIRDLFDDVVSAAMAGAAKPDRPIFDMAVAVGGASAAQTLHVGDHPLYDVHGARDAGLKAIWVNRNGDRWPDEYHAPDAEVQHVGELHELLERDAS
ncbi:MAG: HAD family hydrolase [Gammaproteobacteria bacterium]|nr:HAD family hydrolase [Gammaproteobacteria bacterium]MBU2676834.1 HAD family hydrolase [Gammaproteobacteria bacterium]NNC58258.1 HAD family hydrolase [Woeseiaceae bacterium]NNL50568.1 HAD family hydrolase [Woeseiaceae bacterium]